ncbi:MAG: VWA domain-containing protein [Acidobacteria bacterium]|nr:VWA domain-containing protein [Acidobacteriota bacterium]
MRRPLHRHVIAVFLLFAALFAGAPVTAQDDPESELGEIFFDSVEVNVVNVDVFVTDRQGNPVHGLTRDDFELLQDGKPVEVTNFLAVEDGAEGGPGVTVRDLGTEPINGTAAAPPPAQLPPDQRLHVVIFIDNLNIRPNSRNQVIDRLRRFLRDSLDNQDRVMLVSFDGSVHILQELTSIPELVQDSLDKLEKASARGMDIDVERQRILRDIEDVQIDASAFSDGTAEVFAHQALEAIRTHAAGIQGRTRFTLNAMSQLVDSLAGLSGRKALVYVSGGISLRPGQALFQAWQAKFGQVPNLVNSVAGAGETLSYDTTLDYQKLIAKANANRVIFYTIDAADSGNFGAVSAEVGGFDLSALNTQSAGRTWTSELETVERSGVRQAFQLLADSTGGLAFINTRGLGKTLGQLASDFESYYSLGYAPAGDPDGKYHRLEVKLKDGKGYKVRNRAGYQDKTQDDRMSDRTLSALLLNAQDNPLGIELERAAGTPEEKGVYTIPLLLKVPLGQLALLPDQDYHRGRLSVFIAVRDEKGGTSDVTRIPLPINIPNDKINEALDQYAGYEFKVRMKEGFQRVAVGVRDEVAAVNSTLRLNFRVGG